MRGQPNIDTTPMTRQAAAWEGGWDKGVQFDEAYGLSHQVQDRLSLVGRLGRW
jgi:hypothetical protein